MKNGGFNFRGVLFYKSGVDARNSLHLQRKSHRASHMLLIGGLTSHSRGGRRSEHENLTFQNSATFEMQFCVSDLR
jgi:hypothetical protein